MAFKFVEYRQVEQDQQFKQTTEFVYRGGAISESVDLDTEIKHCIGDAWASIRR